MPVPAGVACCGTCLQRPPPLDACHAAVDYAYPWAGLVARCKFEGEPGWAGLLAELAAGAQGVAAELASADLLLPMPLAAQRLAWRGFNQSLEIARRLAPAKVDAGLLLRLRETRPQAELQRDGRRANVRGAFGVEPQRAAEVAGRRIVLVDDVMTSGASLHAAAQALRQARAARVAAVVVARTDETG